MANILIIIAPKDFRDEEYFETVKELQKAGHSIVTASSKVGQITGSRGGQAESQALIKDINVSSFDAVALIGGSGSYIYDNDILVHKIVNDFNDQNKIVAAICHAPIIVTKAGVYKGKNVTVFNGDINDLKTLGANYSGPGVVVDGKYITADGPNSATAFGKKLATILT